MIFERTTILHLTQDKIADPQKAYKDLLPSHRKDEEWICNITEDIIFLIEFNTVDEKIIFEESLPHPYSENEDLVDKWMKEDQFNAILHQNRM